MLTIEQKNINQSGCLNNKFGYNINTKAEKTILTPEQCEKIRLSKLGKTRSKKSFVGVYRSGKNWMARIGFYGEEIYLGNFKSKREATSVYQEALVQAIKNVKPTISEDRISKNKPVIQKDLEGNVIKRFPSLHSVKEDGHSQITVWRNCVGITKNPRTYIWEYE